MYISRIQHNSEIYMKIQFTDVYENTLTSMGASLTGNHHLRATMTIQRYSAHAARPS